MPCSVAYISLNMTKMCVNFIMFNAVLVQPKCAKIQLQETFSAGLNALKFFCLPLYTEFLSDLYKKFQVAFTHNKNV